MRPSEIGPPCQTSGARGRGILSALGSPERSGGRVRGSIGPRHRQRGLRSGSVSNRSPTQAGGDSSAGGGPKWSHVRRENATLSGPASGLKECLTSSSQALPGMVSTRAPCALTTWIESPDRRYAVAFRDCAASKHALLRQRCASFPAHACARPSSEHLDASSQGTVSGSASRRGPSRAGRTSPPRAGLATRMMSRLQLRLPRSRCTGHPETPVPSHARTAFLARGNASSEDRRRRCPRAQVVPSAASGISSGEASSVASERAEASTWGSTFRANHRADCTLPV